MKNDYLSDYQQKKLRALGVVGKDEVVQKSGDLFIAINVLTNQRRVIHFDKGILEEDMSDSAGKRVLKG